MKKMEGLPEGMIPDRDNIVYFDTEKFQFYIIQWEETGNNDIPHRHYIQLPTPAHHEKLGS
jgi:hypothetical protein